MELPYLDTTNSPISLLATVKSSQVVDCKIDENVLIDEKTSVKQSHIGPACIIESKTRVSDCVIMGNVTIKQRFVYLFPMVIIFFFFSL